MTMTMTVIDSLWMAGCNGYLGGSLYEQIVMSVPIPMVEVPAMAKKPKPPKPMPKPPKPKGGKGC